MGLGEATRRRRTYNLGKNQNHRPEMENPSKLRVRRGCWPEGKRSGRKENSTQTRKRRNKPPDQEGWGRTSDKRVSGKEVFFHVEDFAWWDCWLGGEDSRLEGRMIKKARKTRFKPNHTNIRKWLCSSEGKVLTREGVGKKKLVSRGQKEKSKSKKKKGMKQDCSAADRSLLFARSRPPHNKKKPFNGESKSSPRR